MAVISVFINFAIGFNEAAEFAEAKVHLLTSLQDLLSSESSSSEADPELLYRLLVVLGTLAYGDRDCRSLAIDLEIPAMVAGLITACVGERFAHLQLVGAELAQLFRS